MKSDFATKLNRQISTVSKLMNEVLTEIFTEVTSKRRGLHHAIKRLIGENLNLQATNTESNDSRLKTVDFDPEKLLKVNEAKILAEHAQALERDYFSE